MQLSVTPLPGSTGRALLLIKGTRHNEYHEPSLSLSPCTLIPLPRNFRHRVRLAVYPDRVLL